MTIIEKIDMLRKERGWSVNYLAMEAGLTQSTLNNMYQRNAEPKLSTLRAICSAFGISLSEFFADEEPESEIEEIKHRISLLDKEKRQAILTLLRDD